MMRRQFVEKCKVSPLLRETRNEAEEQSTRKQCHVIRENELQMFCRVGGAVVYGDKKNLSQSVSLIPSFSDIVQQRQSIRKS